MNLGCGGAFQREESPSSDTRRRDARSFGEQETLPTLLTGTCVFTETKCVFPNGTESCQKDAAVENWYLGAGEMAQLVKFLPDKCEDLSLDSQNQTVWRASVFSVPLGSEGR